MTKHGKLFVLLGGVATYVTILVAILAIPPNIPPINISIAIYGTIVFALFLVTYFAVYYSWWNRRGEKRQQATIPSESPGLPEPVSEKTSPIIVTPAREPPPNLDVYPLQHFKGYVLPPKIETKDLGDGRKESTSTVVGPSNPDEYGRLTTSQKLEVIRMQADKPTPLIELIVKFGVIRVYCVEGDALGCRAELKYRIVEQLGRKLSMAMVSGGYLNWFSPSTKRDIQTHLESIDAERGRGLNKYLRNTLEDMYQGDEKDLLVFYMIKDAPSVFLCTDVDQASLGPILSGKGLKAEVEVALTAQRFPKTFWRFLITVADWDDFDIQRM